MKKIEKDLIKAIESKDSDKATDLLATFAEGHSDEQANEYFEKIQAIGSDEVVEEAPKAKKGKKAKKEEVIEADSRPDLCAMNLTELKALAEQDGVFYNVNSKEKGLINALLRKNPEGYIFNPAPVEVAPRVENRGQKAKVKGRVELEKGLTELYESSIDFLSVVKRDNSADTKFARRMVKDLRILAKKVIR